MNDPKDASTKIMGGAGAAHEPTPDHNDALPADAALDRSAPLPHTLYPEIHPVGTILLVSINRMGMTPSEVNHLREGLITAYSPSRKHVKLAASRSTILSAGQWFALDEVHVHEVLSLPVSVKEGATP